MTDRNLRGALRAERLARLALRREKAIERHAVHPAHQGGVDADASAASSTGQLARQLIER